MLSVRLCYVVAGVVALALGLGGCQSPKATFERVVLGDPAKPYLGMSKSQIIACAGTPSGSFVHGTQETLVYHYSGAGPVPGTAPKKPQKDPAHPFAKSSQDKNWACSASLLFDNGALTHVSFAPQGVVSPYATKSDPKTGEKLPVPQPAPCTFSLPNCSR